MSECEFHQLGQILVEWDQKDSTIFWANNNNQTIVFIVVHSQENYIEEIEFQYSACMFVLNLLGDCYLISVGYNTIEYIKC